MKTKANASPLCLFCHSYLFGFFLNVQCVTMHCSGVNGMVLRGERGAFGGGLLPPASLFNPDAVLLAVVTLVASVCENVPHFGKRIVVCYGASASAGLVRQGKLSQPGRGWPGGSRRGTRVLLGAQAWYLFPARHRSAANGLPSP